MLICLTHTLHNYSTENEDLHTQSRRQFLMNHMRDCAEHQPEIDPRHRESRYSRCVWQRPNNSKQTEKYKIYHGKLEAVKWT